MLSDGYQAADVIRPLYDSLASANLSHIGITCCEGQGWSMQRNLTLEVQAAGAENLTSLTTTHAYKGEPAEPDGPLNTTLKVWITENSPIMKRLGVSYKWYDIGEENEGHNWANLLHDAFTTGNVSAYIYWIGAGPSPAEAPLIVIPRRAANATTGTPYYRLAANYYAFAHFSRFVRPGAVRVGLEHEAEGVKATAFRNPDGSVAVHVVNNGNGTAALEVDLPRHSTRQQTEVATWLTDNAHNMTLVKTETTAGVALGEAPAKSLVTFVVGYRERRGHD
jgi:O-glycosyl hydrolase